MAEVIPELACTLAKLRSGNSLTGQEAFYLVRQVDELLMRAENMRALVDRYVNSLTNISMTVNEEVTNAGRIQVENMRALVDRYANSLTNISMTVSEEVMNARRQA